MGQKVNPKGLRIGILNTWDSRWYATKDFAKFIGEDIRIRKYVKDKLSAAGISKVEIERAASRMRINIFTAKPGLVIGRKGTGSEEIKKELRDLVGRDVAISIVEARKAEMDAQLVAEAIAFQLERRVNFRRAMKEGATRAIRMGAEGVKVCIGGRLNGADIARTEKFREGRVPLHTLRADIDYATAEAHTTYGLLGIKVWIFKGEKFSAGEAIPVESMML
jgi:small subunit ribosomal protein S3